MKKGFLLGFLCGLPVYPLVFPFLYVWARPVADAWVMGIYPKYVEFVFRLTGY